MFLDNMKRKIIPLHVLRKREYTFKYDAFEKKYAYKVTSLVENQFSLYILGLGHFS